jgi:hypothetical protein
MSPEFIKKWEQLLEDVDMHRIPVEFIRKLILKLEGKRQHTINIEKLIAQGLDPESIEEVLGKKLFELQDEIVRVEYVLNVQSIAEAVQPETDKLLNNL